MVPVLTQVSRWAGTGSVVSCTLAVTSILAVHFKTRILVDFTVSACTHRHTHTQDVSYETITCDCLFIDVCLHLKISTHSLIYMYANIQYIHTFKLWCADTLIGIDEIPAGGVVLARGRQTLIVLLFTVQAMVALMGQRYMCIYKYIFTFGRLWDNHNHGL